MPRPARCISEDRQGGSSRCSSRFDPKPETNPALRQKDEFRREFPGKLNSIERGFIDAASSIVKIDYRSQCNADKMSAVPIAYLRCRLIFTKDFGRQAGEACRPNEQHAGFGLRFVAPLALAAY